MTSTSRALALAVLVATATAAGAKELQEDDPYIIGSEAFLRGHPDVLWRWRGVAEYQRQRYKEAVNDFLDAARYADKPSQAMLAMMYWNGDGIGVDRIQAYAWIDLAAERNYPSFIATRDRFWAALGEDERPAALEAAKALRTKYGDEHAQGRQGLEMMRAKLNVTGSHLGYAGNLSIKLPGPDGRMRSFSGPQLYRPRYWSPKEYWTWQDQIWEPQGQVEVGPVQPVGDDAGDAPQDER